MSWLDFVSSLLSKIPIERVLIPRPDHAKALREFAANMESSTSPETSPNTQTAEEPPKNQSEGVSRALPTTSPTWEVSLEETIKYQNREIGKLLLRMESHYAQKLRIAGVPCDCGSSKHLLDMESLCEETIPMVENPEVYYRILDWVKEVGPKSTDVAAKSGLHDEEYPNFSHQARDFRKSIIGALEPSALFPQKPGEPEGARILPVISEVERKEIREKAHKKIDEVLGATTEQAPAVIPIEPQPPPGREPELEFLPDSSEDLAKTINDTGYRQKLDNAFQEAIARVKGLK